MQDFELSRPVKYIYIGIQFFAHEQNEKLVKFDIKFCYRHKKSHSIFIIIVKQLCLFIKITIVLN